jgi:putative radical SAM enzyme (TIGR03279 family)
MSVNKHEHVIKNVLPDSIAEEMGIEPGDKLISINDSEVGDVFDYHFLVNDEELVLLIKKPDGEEWELEIEKEFEEDLGIEFEQGLMDEYRSCKNKCIFCFIDQMPKGMRETLYFKDDDSRLSFLQGNYVTLTNMSDHDISRIVNYRLEPINISFHTMNPQLRRRMLHNRFAGEALKKVDRLYEGGILMNGQIVLCKGINDGEELERSIRELTKYIPCLQSVSVVPVGLTRYREGLYPLEPFRKEDARQVLETIHLWQDRIYKEHGIHFIHGGDEWYILAGEEVPEQERYDGYLQLENGVGMLRLLEDEFQQAYEEAKGDGREREVSVATGVLAYPYIRKMAEKLRSKYPKTKIHIYPIQNDFFGKMITVSGLITGRDLIAQLRGRELGERLLLPCNMFRSGEEVFLDDVTLSEVEEALQVRADIVKSSGQDFVEAVLRV